jgi:hypothetical protein
VGCEALEPVYIMGYRSNGKWVIQGPAEQVAAFKVQLHLEGSPDNVLEELEFFSVGDTGFIRLTYEGWKWYRTYPSIDWLEALWSRLEAFEEKGWSGQLIRLGEEAEDVEELQFGEEYPLSVSREILDDAPETGDPL